MAERQTIEAESMCSYVFLALINVHSLEGGTAVQRSRSLLQAVQVSDRSLNGAGCTACTGALYCLGCSLIGSGLAAVKEAAGEVVFFSCFKKL